jgi:hypothetical protein
MMSNMNHHFDDSIKYINQKLREIESYQYKDLSNLKKNNMECPICMSIILGVAKTICGHYFCSFCIFKYIGMKNYFNEYNDSICPIVTCPICRKNLLENDIIIDLEMTQKLDDTLIECNLNECRKIISRKQYIGHLMEHMVVIE